MLLRNFSRITKAVKFQAQSFNGPKSGILSTLSSQKSGFHSSSFSSRNQMSEEDHKKEAESWLAKLPGVDKPYSFVLGTSVATFLLSKEIVPYNGDLIYMIPFSTAIYVLFKLVGPTISGSIDSAIKEEDAIWNDAKTKAVKRLEEDIHQITGSGITDLEDITKGLYDHARQVATNESKAFEHEQIVAYNTKAKQILDEWVRYETAMKEREQSRISEEVLAAVEQAIKDPKFQERYMEQCISDVESALA